MNRRILNFRKLVVFLSSMLVWFVVSCPAADQTVLVVAQDGAQLFYHQNGHPTDMEFVPKGTELTIEGMDGERCFVTYKGKPAYIRRRFLATKQECFESEQKAKGLIQYQEEWITPEERDIKLKREFEAKQEAKEVVQYEGQWMTSNEVVQAQQRETEARQRKAKEEEQRRQEQAKEEERQQQEQSRREKEKQEQARLEREKVEAERTQAEADLREHIEALKQKVVVRIATGQMLTINKDEANRMELSYTAKEVAGLVVYMLIAGSPANVSMIHLVSTDGLPIKEAAQLQEYLTKAIQWSQTARENHVSGFSKELGSVETILRQPTAMDNIKERSTATLTFSCPSTPDTCGVEIQKEVELPSEIGRDFITIAQVRNMVDLLEFSLTVNRLVAHGGGIQAALLQSTIQTEDLFK